MVGDKDVSKLGPSSCRSAMFRILEKSTRCVRLFQVDRKENGLGVINHFTHTRSPIFDQGLKEHYNLTRASEWLAAGVSPADHYIMCICYRLGYVRMMCRLTQAIMSTTWWCDASRQNDADRLQCWKLLMMLSAAVQCPARIMAPSSPAANSAANYSDDWC